MSKEDAILIPTPWNAPEAERKIRIGPPEKTYVQYWPDEEQESDTVAFCGEDGKPFLFMGTADYLEATKRIPGH